MKRRRTERSARAFLIVAGAQNGDAGRNGGCGEEPRRVGAEVSMTKRQQSMKIRRKGYYGDVGCPDGSVALRRAGSGKEKRKPTPRVPVLTEGCSIRNTSIQKRSFLAQREPANVERSELERVVNNKKNRDTSTGYEYIDGVRFFFTRYRVSHDYMAGTKVHMGQRLFAYGMQARAS